MANSVTDTVADTTKGTAPFAAALGVAPVALPRVSALLIVVTLVGDNLPVLPALRTEHAEPESPERGGEDHAARGDPADDEEFLAPASTNADIVCNIVELVNALSACDSDDDRADGEGKGAEEGEDEVDEDHGTAGGKDEGPDAAEDSEAAETHANHVDDEDSEEEVVDKVELVLDLGGPVNVGEVDAQVTELELLVEHIGEVETVYFRVCQLTMLFFSYPSP